MPIEVFCQSCQKKLRVPDTAAGKRIKCPKCQGVLNVPAAGVAPATGSLSGAIPTPSKMASKSSASIPVPTPAPKSGLAKAGMKPKEQWFVQTEDGQQYGPVSRTELDQWYADGRITTDTQILLEGGEQWQWASDLYPDLAPEQPAAGAATAGGIPDFGAMAAGGAGVKTSSGPFDFSAPSAGSTSTTSSVASRGRKGGKKGKGKKGGGTAHIDYLAYFSYAMGGILLLVALLFMAGGGFLASLIGAEGGGIILTVFMVFGVFFLILSLPMFAAGYGLQQRASWAKLLTLILAVMNGLGGLGTLNPVQIGYAVYAFIVLFDKKNADAFV